MHHTTSLERITAAFRDAGLAVDRIADRASCQAPGHSSQDRSVSLQHDWRSKRTLMYCHAGEETADVLGAVGLTLGDLFDEQERRYEYPDGRVVTRTYTGNQKNIRQTGGSVQGASLFRINFAPNSPVYITEGEEGVLAAESCGLNATCNASGAKNASKADWTPVYGRDIIIVRDNDPTGGEFVDQVRECLDGHVNSVRVVQSATCGKGDDLVDHLAAGKAVEDLVPVMSERDLWERPELDHIRRFALSRYANPLAVVMGVMGRVVAATDPTLKLPAIVGAPASLNSMFAFVGPSGSGKGKTEGAARDAVQLINPAIEETVGSGEGLGRLFSFQTNAEGEYTTQRHRRAYLSVTEVDRLTAIAQRQGSTITAVLRAAWSGEPLGALNAGATSTFTPAHSYRAVLSIGVQPDAAAGLLHETNGTAQRMVWIPVGMSSELYDQCGGEPPAPLVLTALPAPPGCAPMTHELSIGETLIAVPDGARRQIQDQHRAVATMGLRGSRDVDPLDGHKLLARLKVAAGLMLLAGRHTEMSDDDWALAGVVMAESDRVRSELESILAEKASRENRAKGRAAADRADAETNETVRKAANQIVSKLQKADGGPISPGELRRTLRSNLRADAHAAIDELLHAGVIAEVAGGLMLVDGAVHVDTLSTSNNSSSEHVDTPVHVDTPTNEDTAPDIPGAVTEHTPGMTPRVERILAKQKDHQP